MRCSGRAVLSRRLHTQAPRQFVGTPLSLVVRRHVYVIDTSNADGSTPRADCLAAREWMATYYDSAIIPLRVFSDTEVPVRGRPVFGSTEDMECVAHVRQCGDCRDWMHTVADEKWVVRQGRLARYCCAQMFGAVEEPKSSSHKIEWLHAVHPDYGPFWSIDGKATHLAFCPWCGHRMPSKPFVEPSLSDSGAEGKQLSPGLEALEREVYNRAKRTVMRLRDKYEEQ